jgi:hypothetical protein
MSWGVTQRSGGVGLELSDGRQLALGSVAYRTRQRLAALVDVELLHPIAVEHDRVSYCLLLRGNRGTELELNSRRMALITTWA